MRALLLLWVAFAFICGMVYSAMPAEHNWQWWFILIAVCVPFAISGYSINEWVNRR